MKRYIWLAALVAACAPAGLSAQSITVDVARDGGGNPELDADGNWVWEVFYNSDADGGAAGIELGMDFADADLVSATPAFTGFLNGGLEVPTVGVPVFGWETLGGGFNGQFAEGFQVDLSQGTNGQAFLAGGTGVFSPFGSALLATFVTDGPSTAGSLVSSISVIGAYDASGNVVSNPPGTHGIVGESDGATAVNAFGSITAIAGDVNLDGMVDFDDLDIVDMNLGQSLPGGWGVGDLDGSGTVDPAERAFVRANIPEPTTLTLFSALAALAAAAARRR